MTHLFIAIFISCALVACGSHGDVLARIDAGAIVDFKQTTFEINESGQDALGKTFFIHGWSLKSIKKIEFDVKCACFEPSLERSAFSPGEDVPVYIHVDFGQMQGRVLKNFRCIFYDEQGVSQAVIFRFDLNLRKAYVASEDFIMLRMSKSGLPTTKFVEIELAKEVSPLVKVDAADARLVDISWEANGERKYKISITPRTVAVGNKFTDINVHTSDRGRFSSIRIPLVMTDAN